MWGRVYVCAPCTCVHTHTHSHPRSGHRGAHTCVHSAWGLTGSACGWAARVWAGVCCAQAPPDGALPPCHLLGTQTCSLRGDMGGFMRGHHALCQAEPPPRHSQGRVTGTVTPACANASSEKIKGVDQRLGGTAGGGFAAGGGLVAGKQAQLGEAAGSVCDLGGWAAPPSPIVSTYFWVSMAPRLQRP